MHGLKLGFASIVAVAISTSSSLAELVTTDPAS